jgi:hypothetical protein
MWDYWFFNNESGEEFFVECDTEDEAWEIVEENDLNDGNLEIVQVITPDEADIIGLDTF